MPHKHKRNDKPGKDFNLPPDTVAKPLPVNKSKPASSTPTSTSKTDKTSKARSRSRNDQSGPAPSKKRKRPKASDDDTPKAFARLMAFQNGVKPKSGLDDGTRRSDAKKQKTTAAAGTPSSTAKKSGATNTEAASTTSIPQIMPGERMADFSARVDAALPISGLAKKGNIKVDGVKRPRTKLERKITRMQDEWREREARMRAKAADEAEDAEIEAILNGDEGAKASIILKDPDEVAGKKKGGKKKGKKGRKGGAGGDGEDSDGDPWAVVAKARKAVEGARTGLVGVHDVVQAPPKFAVAPRERFKSRTTVEAEA